MVYDPIQTFAEVADVKKALKLGELIGLIVDKAGRDEELIGSPEADAVIQEAIEYASGQMIPLLRKYDVLPLTSTDPSLKGICVDIALWWLMDRSPKRGKEERNPFEKRMERAFTRLEMRLTHRHFNNGIVAQENLFVSTSSDIEEDYSRDDLRERW